MSLGRLMRKEDVVDIKKWLEKGLKTSDVAEITGRSRDTVNKVRSGFYDYLLKENYETPEMKICNRKEDKLDEIIVLLNVIAERLGGGDA